MPCGTNLHSSDGDEVTEGVSWHVARASQGEEVSGMPVQIESNRPVNTGEDDLSELRGF